MSFEMHITLEHVLGSVSGHHDGELVPVPEFFFTLPGEKMFVVRTI